MRIATVGSGGVGGYFGGRLAAAGSDVAFLARGAHLAALKSSGLRIQSPMGDLHLPTVTATDDPAAIGPVDVVFFAVKLYDTDGALALLPPLLGPETVVVPFQNGVDSVDLLTRAVGAPHVAGGTAYVAAVIAEPGLIRHTAMDTMIFGELDGSRSPRLERLLDACAEARFHAVLSDHIQGDIWAKFARLATFSGMTAITRSPVGVIREDPDLLAMWQAATLETIAVAKAKGVPLPAGVFDETMKNLESLPPNAKSSMLEDLERGRRLELPWLSGAVVRMGRELQVDTPIHRFIAAVLAPLVGGRER
jgi:2-dehydropantoate 2-reductase